MATAKANSQSHPARITKLSEDVINKIAAGEVIQRPSNALKELLENSLDAKSTQIKLFLRDGGISELRIEDNGSGILKDDFPLLCERFATSKLNTFEDLYSVATYGFRGEALASISFCAQLSITSKTIHNQSCAYRAHFINGHMYDPDNPDIDHKQIKPSMVAGMPGTQIIVKKLFYNMSLRQKALKSRWSQEYNSCLRVVSCYAIHNYHCSFSVQKLSDTSANSLDLNVRTNPKKRAKDVIKAIYGGNIASYLIEINKDHSKIKGLCIKGVISNCDFAMNVSNASNRSNRSKKRIFNTNNKMEFVLFINNRLVESNMIKKCIMSVYEDYLAKNHYPFVYLSINIPPNFVDVNVHPTKKEVKFLHQNEVLQLIQEGIHDKLKVENDSRTFHAHSLQHFMTQSNANTSISVISPKKKKMRMDKTEERNNNNKREQLVVHKKGDMLSLGDSDEASEDVDMDFMDKDDKNGESNSVSPHAPLRRRTKKRIVNMNDSNVDDTHSNDNKDSNNNNNMHIDDADKDGTNDNHNRYNLRRSNRYRNNNDGLPLRRSAIKRKRTYSDIISTDEDEEPPQDDHSMNSSSKQTIVTINLSETKKYKAKKATRVRVDSQQSSLDYYWKAAAHNHANKRRKIKPSNTAEKNISDNKENPKSNHNHNMKNEQKMSESDDDDVKDTKNEWRRDTVTFLPKKQMQKKVITAPKCVDGLITMINKNGDANLKKIFEENVYVGCIDNIDKTHKNRKKKSENEEYIDNTFQRVLFQYDTKLFLCNIHRISRVYFFEICVNNIGRFRSIYNFVPNSLQCDLPSIYDLVLLALELEESDYNEEEMGAKDDVAESITSTLCQKSVAKVLYDYFSIEIDTENRRIKSIPCLIDGYIPPLLYLPMFLFRLIAEVEWFKGDHDEENEEIDLSKQLFKQIAMEIARFYQFRAPQFYLKLDKTQSNKKGHRKFGGYLDNVDDLNNKHNLGWILQHVIFRSMNKKCTKYSFHPPHFLCNDGSIVQIACTQQLYKVFERC